MAQSPFLAALGITPIQQARVPTADGFPPVFNPNHRTIWDRVVQEMPHSGNTMKDWGLAIRDFVDACEAQGSYAFVTFHQNRNDMIVSHLQARRRVFVKFVNHTDFFKDVYLRTTHRKVAMTDTGFTIIVYAEAIIDDPTFVQWLQQMPYPKLQLQTNTGRYIRTLMDDLEVVVENDYNRNMSQRWRIGYEINCPIFPDVPGNPTPSKGELERFVLDVLWMPLLRGMRPIRGLRRLI